MADNKNNQKKQQVPTVTAPRPADSQDLTPLPVEMQTEISPIPVVRQNPVYPVLSAQPTQPAQPSAADIGAALAPNANDGAQPNTTASSAPPPTVSDYDRERGIFADRRRKLDEENQALQTPVTKSQDSRGHSMLEALWKGLEAFDPKYGYVKNWQDFLTRAAAVPGAAIGAAINPTWDENQQRVENLQRNEQQRKQLGDEENDFYQNQQRDATAEFTRLKPELEKSKQENAYNVAVLKAKQAELREQQKAAAEGGKFSTVWSNGKLLRIFKDPTKPPEVVTYDDGTEVVEPTKETVSVGGYNVTGRDALLAQTAGNQRAYQGEQSYQDQVNKFNSDVAEVKGKITGAQTQLQTVNGQIAALEEKVKGGNAYDQDLQLLSGLKKQQGELTGTIQQYNTQLQSMRPPQRVAPPPAPSVGKYAGSVFNSPGELRSYFPNKSDDEIRQIVTSNGGKFNQ